MEVGGWRAEIVRQETKGLMSGEEKLVLVTGATGYIGGRLVPRLLEGGFWVRCLARSARKLENRPWAGHPRVEILTGDVGDEATLTKAMGGCWAAYYLVHSMVAAGKAYAERDRQLAELFGRCAAAAKVRRIIYLGGLGETGPDLSEHLASRREVEAALRLGGVPVTVLRAAMIIGAGSASFEILRYLVERLPVMVTPRWVSTPCQPIAVRNVLHYLVACLTHEGTAGREVDIGGADVKTYREVMQMMAAALGLRRRIIVPVPVLTPRLSSLWIHLVTPISKDIARPLAEGLRNPVVCRSDEAQRLMPQGLLTIAEAIHEAVRSHARGEVETSWSDAGPIPGDPDWAGGTVFEDCRMVTVAAPLATVWATLCRVGGTHGWFAARALWWVRGVIDRLLGGPGLRRGRRHGDQLGYGDALDFWRVVGVERPRELRLRAEMRLPGEAELNFFLEPVNGDTTRVTQLARFKPRGLAGLVYWGAVLPFHAVVFRGMLRGLQREAETAVR